MDGLYKGLEARDQQRKNELIRRSEKNQYYIRMAEAKPLTPRERRIVDDFPGWKARVQHKLESISSGKVYGPDSGLRAIDFVRERGGFVDPDEYKKQFPPYDSSKDEN
jgi:hypothetical protein